MADLVTGLGGPDGFGTGELGPTDDGSTGPIDITAAFADGLDLFGSVYTSIYINNNGNITFTGPLNTYTPSAIGTGFSSPIIAPFWGDVDTYGGPTTPTGGNSQGSDLVWYDVSAATHTVTITWDDVGYYPGDAGNPNAFQLQLIAEPNGYAEVRFIYQAIEWTAGGANGGSNGLGGMPARAGYSAGDGVHYYELPASNSQAALLALPTTDGNTGLPGIYEFQSGLDGIYSFASPTLSTGTSGTLGVVSFGNVHAGAVEPTQLLQITNSATSPAEDLDAQIASADPGVVGNGSISLLAAGDTDTSDISVGLDTGAAGLHHGDVVIAFQSDGSSTSGAGLTNLPDQTVEVSGAVYNLAQASLSTAPIVLHVGASGAEVLDVANAAATGSYSEGLLAIVKGFGGQVVSATGTAALIAAGRQNTTSLGFVLATGTVGTITGDILVATTSDGAGTSGLGLTNLGTQTFAVSGVVENYATASIVEASGAAPLVQVAGDYTIDLGTVAVGATAPTVDLGLSNTALSLADLLEGTVSGTGDAALVLSGTTSFSGIAAGGTESGLVVTLSTAKGGSFSRQITFDPTGYNASGYAGTLAPEIVTITGVVADLAQASVSPTGTIDFGAVRAGTTASEALSIGNVAASGGQALDAAASATGDATATGNIADLAAGAAASTAIVVGLDTSGGGVRGGTVSLTFASDNGTGGVTALTAQDTAVAVTGTVYNLASYDVVSAAPTIWHVGAAGTGELTIGNAAPSPYSETLDAEILGAAGAVAATAGATADIAAQQTGELGFSVATATAGTVDGSVQVQFASDGTGTDGAAATTIGTQTIAIEGTVDNFATLGLAASSGALSLDGGNFVLNLGTVLQDGSVGLSATLSMFNAATGPADALDSSVSLLSEDGLAYGGAGFVADLAAGASADALSVSLLSTATVGTFSESFLIQSSGTNASGYSGSLGQHTLTVTGTVLRVPAPELQVGTVAAPPTALAGQEVAVSWTLVNNGDGAAVGPWSDEVFVSGDAEADDPVSLGLFQYNGTLAPGATVTLSEAVTLPGALTGNEWIGVRADAADQLVEHVLDSTKVTTATEATAISAPAGPDLVVSTITTPTTGFSGQPSEVSWTVANTGDGGTSSGSWYDNVYLSVDQTLDASNDGRLGADSDLLLASVANPSYLAPGDAYTSSATFTLPQGISGPYYIIVQTNSPSPSPEPASVDDQIGVSSVFPIDLTPPPNLQVTKVLAAPEAFSGQPITIDYTVQDNGSGPTVATDWTDEILVSMDGSLDSTAVELGTVDHSGELAPGASYSGSATVTLPVGIGGAATFFVVTDFGNAVYEGALHADDSGGTATTTNVAVTPPPDLVASITSAPTMALAGHGISFTYQVANDGSTATPNTNWVDEVYLSQHATLDASASLETGGTHWGALDVGQTYSVTTSLDLPYGISGTYYVIIQTNAGNQVFELDTANDVAVTGAITVADQQPDLTVASLTAPAGGKAGQQVAVSWQVTNTGAGDTGATGWDDNIVLSASGVLGAADNVVLGAFAAPTGPLAAGASYAQNAVITLPLMLSGAYTLFVVTDTGDSAPESNFANNASAGQSFDVSRYLADLQVASVTVPGSVTAGDTATVTWTVDNTGSGPTDSSYWSDALYVSTTPTLSAGSVLISAARHVNTVASGGTYSASADVTLPLGLAAGSYYFIVVADAEDQVTQVGYADDSGASSAVNLVAAASVSADSGLALADLQVASVTAPATVSAGGSVALSWTIDNAGTGATDAGAWYDDVYISATPTLSATAVLLGDAAYSGALAAGGSYTGSGTFTLPTELPAGSYHFIVVADAQEQVTQTSYADDSGASSVAILTAAPAGAAVVGGAAPGIVVGSGGAVPAAPPDIEVTGVTAPVTAISGQTITVSYTLSNQGGTTPSGWYDEVYLSRNQVPGGTGDIPIGYVLDSPLAAGASTVVSQTFTIPDGQSGPFWVIVDGDAGGTFPTDPDPANNDAVSSEMDVSLPAVADFTVASVTVPAAATIGGNVAISYTVDNDSALAEAGSWSDAVYLSATGTWDASDKLIGYVDHTGGVAAEGSYTGTLDAQLPGVAAGTYDVIVRTNIRSEAAGTNATGVSAGTITVGVPALTLGTAATGTLGAGQATYYQFTVAAGQTVNVSLTSDDPSSINNIYLRYGTLPTLGQFDATSIVPTLADPDAVIQATQPGTYYVMVTGDSVTGTEDYSLTARTVPFTVSHITPDYGSNLGSVTLTITGAQFNADERAEVVASDGTTRTATEVRWVNGTELWATFNLVGLAVGTYSVEVGDAAQSATLAEAFQVNSGPTGNVSVNILLPQYTREGQNGTVTVDYTNTGDTDAVAPVLELSSPQAMLTTGPGADGSNTALFLATNPDGPAGILQPGQSGSATYSYDPTDPTPHEIFNFTIGTLPTDTPPDVETPLAIEITSTAESAPSIDWSSVWSGLEAPLRPATVDAADWGNVWARFVAEMGTTTTSVEAALSAAATELAQVGEPTTDVGTLLQYELFQATGAMAGTYLTDATDIAPGSSSLSLSLDRYYDATLLTHYAAGAFGDGWTSTYEVSAATDSSGNVLIQSPGALHIFTLQADGSYLAKSGDPATLAVIAGLYRMTDAGTVEDFRADGKLASITDANSNVVTLTYTGAGVLQQIADGTTGETITFTANAQGRITTATDSDGTKITYTYDSTGTLLLSATGPGGTTSYAYAATAAADDNALTSITNPDGTQEIFTYDTQGRLATQSGAGGSGELTYTYPSSGEMTVTDALGNQTNVLYGANGEIAQVQDPSGNATQLQYDANGNLVGAITPGNSIYQYGYNAAGDLTSYVDPLGGTTTASYAPGTQNLTGFANQLGASTHYTYDAAGNVTGIVYQDGSGDTYDYTANGLLSSSTDADGHTTSYTYDSAGNLMGEKFADGTSNSYSYDTYGNLLTATASATGTTAYTYNAANQLLSVANPQGQVETYTYNADGQLATRTEPDGSETQYSYDSSGRLVELQDGSGNMLDKYSYDEAGQLVRTDTGNGASTTYLYNANGNVAEILDRNADGSVASRDDYTYNANSQVVSDVTNDGTWTYGYDASGELTSAVFASTSVSVASQNIAYSYDAAGNRISQTVNGVTTTYTTNALNQYTAAGGTTYTYDADGNMTSETDATGTTNFVYNDSGQLISQTGPGGTFQYAYDALGNLVAETQNGVTTDYVNDPLSMAVSGQPLTSVGEAESTAGNPLATYDYGLGLASVTDPAGNVSYYDTDLTGNVIGISGPDGTLSDAYFYDPTGQVTQTIGSLSSPFGSSGGFGIMSAGGGLLLDRARYLNTQLGRFMSVDPARLSGGLNSYEFASNDGVNESDPTGLFTYWKTTAGGFGAYGGLTLASSGAALLGESVGVGALVVDGEIVAVAIVAVVDAPFILGALGIAAGLYGIYEGGKDLYEGLTSSGFQLGSAEDAFKTLLNAIPTEKPLEQLGEALGWGKVKSFLANWGADKAKDIVAFLAGLGFDKLTAGSTEGVTPHDPNDISGPAGFGPENFVSAATPLAYRIDFENAATATAPAQNVTVTQTLDPNLDWRTFRLTGFGFDNLTYSLSGSQAFYTAQLDLTATKGYLVDVSAGVNIATGVVTWTFNTIDPATGQTPQNATTGFLPVNDAANDGQAYVSYTVQAKAGVATGDVIDAQATVVFDTQGPINTAAISDTVDAVAPTSSVQALPTQTDATQFNVTWLGTDDASGSGIASYTIYVSTDGGPAAPWLTGTTATNALFTGQTGHTYGFYSVATDNAGNVQATPTAPNTVVQVGTIEPPCFLRGTHILTPSGEVRVETLREGDLVTTASGAARKLRWVGFGRTLVTPRNRDRATPVVVRRHALGEYVPHRDLYVTRGHSLFLDGVLVPVEELINHRSIAWVEEARVVEFYHLELDSHDVVLAEKAPAETYREDANSPQFHNMAMRPETPPVPPCAPVLHDHPKVKEIWRRLSDRAGRLELAFTDDPDLHLLADGIRVDAKTVDGAAWCFRLDRPAANLRIVSRSAIPSMTGLAQDQRRLGVALRRIEIRHEAATVALDWDSDAFGPGFHAPEPAERHRWSNGTAMLPTTPLPAGTTIVLHVNGMLPYPLEVPPIAAAA